MQAVRGSSLGSRPCDSLPSFAIRCPGGTRFRRLGRQSCCDGSKPEQPSGVGLEFVTPHASTDDELLRVREPAYGGRMLAGTLSAGEIRRIGIP